MFLKALRKKYTFFNIYSILFILPDGAKTVLGHVPAIAP